VQGWQKGKLAKRKGKLAKVKPKLAKRKGELAKAKPKLAATASEPCAGDVERGETRRTRSKTKARQSGKSS
jgi:hypothetical protein